MLRKTIVACVCFFLCGCATVQTTQSGFLRDYSSFSESTLTPGLFVDGASRAKELGAYDKFMIDQIEVVLDSDSVPRDVTPEVTADLVEYFYSELVRALIPDYTLVDRPGDGVLSIRVAITDVVPNKPLLNMHWLTRMTKSGFGGATIEAEFLDSLTRKRVIAIVDARQGRYLKPIKGMSRWGYTRDALLQWAEMLKSHLDACQMSDDS